MKRVRMNYCFVMILVITAMFLAAPHAYAVTITVTNTNDSGAGSLRQAIADAASGDTIDFSVTGIITLKSGQLIVNKNLTITGPGARRLTIDGDDSSRIFMIISSFTLNLSGVTITNGRASFPTGWGGGIANEGTLNISNSFITNCLADEFGGGIDNYEGILTVTNCTISGNISFDEGGGIRDEDGTVTIIRSTLSGNDSFYGGGIANYSTTGSTINVIRSTIYNNYAVFYGGGIAADGGTMTLTNSTVSGNDATDGGGGIADDDAVNMTITQCTIAFNTSFFGGGGIDLASTDANINNTILANNTGGSGNNFYSFGGSLNSQGYNLEDATEAGFTGTGDQQNANPNLAAIARNGGPTKTHALRSGSDAIDAIPGPGYNGAPTIDQRGVTRPQGANVDVGAFELKQLPRLTTQAVTDISITSATGNGTITRLGVPNPTAHGMVWNTTGTPTLADNSTNEGAATAIGPFTSNMSGLTPYNTYYVRAYATNASGTAYGNEVTFTTNAESVSVTITEPEDGNVVSGTVIIIATTTSNPTNTQGASIFGVSKVEFYIDDSKIAEDATEPYEADWDTTTTADGSHTIKVIAYNLANETAEDEVTVQVDNAPRVPPEILLNRTRLNFGSTPEAGAASISVASAHLVTGSQTILINNSGGGTLNWAVTKDAEWLTCTPEAGTGPAVVTVSANPSGLAIGTYTAAITVQDPNASNSPQTVPVALKVYSSGTTVPPIGYFETPIDGSTVMSSVPVTGWALDDIEVSSVKIYRAPIPGHETGGLVYIGDAVFVDGARPDVEQAYPDYPKQFQAGWGYMMLTNFLPNQGNGTFTIYAKAVDKEGHEVTLGSKTITCDNANAVKPFGAIDTPGQGGIASGNAYVNFGWALTPQPNTIPLDGSTITVWVNGVPLGSPVYNQYREDIATLFPGYTNSNGAIGYYYLDTTIYTNAVHTIAWSAEDNAGNSDGIGSRYFSIQNIGDSSLTLQASKSKSSSINISRIQQATTSTSPIFVKKGYRTDTIPEIAYPDDEGIMTILVKEDERVEIQLSLQNTMALSSSDPYSYSGCLLFGSHTRPLPLGSFLNSSNGTFYWQIGPAFFGEHLLVFLEKGPDDETSKIQVKVNITSKY